MFGDKTKLKRGEMINEGKKNIDNADSDNHGFIIYLRCK